MLIVFFLPISSVSVHIGRTAEVQKWGTNYAGFCLAWSLMTWSSYYFNPFFLIFFSTFCDSSKNSSSFCLTSPLWKAVCAEAAPRHPAALLTAWSFPTNLKSVFSLELNVWKESVFYKTGFINSQLVRLNAWTLLETSENSEDISQKICNVIEEKVPDSHHL